MARIVVVGSGIVGLAVAARLAARGDEVTVLEKDREIAQHQTGRNSGVVHSGIYYAPGSLKATLSRAGSASMVAFAHEHGVDTLATGKLIVATAADQLAQLHRLADRAAANGVEAEVLTPEQAREHEPYVDCVAALRVPSTAIVDYLGVCRVLAEQVTEHGGQVLLAEGLEQARVEHGSVQVRTTRGVHRADALVNCAGLQSDRVASACGVQPDARIVPFRGEYFELVPERTYLVNGLIYPVPDPRFPFLGVHLTATTHGGVHAGPNAVLALAREGYFRTTVDLGDVADALSWPGLWRLGVKNLVPGAKEVVRSLSKRAFAASLAQLVPGIRPRDLVPAPAGVRAQAMLRDGSMVDDFLVQRAERQVHVLNAPSPAATASLEIAKHLEREVDAVLG